MEKVLIADSLPGAAVELLSAAGIQTDVKTGLSEDEIVAIIADYDGMIVRSATQVTPAIFDAAKKLKVVGRAGVGVDNIDREAATAKGVIVMNTPLGNIQSAAEHALAMLFSLARNIAFADCGMKAGGWPKKESVGTEFKNKTLGIVGLGRIGRIVLGTMRTLGMSIMVYDPFLTAEAATELDVEAVDFNRLLEHADFMTIHTPLTDTTRNMIAAEQFKKMKKTARLVNCARGGIVNEADLAAALHAGEIAGAALDVFEEEPLAEDSVLRAAPNLVLTPHLGASTSEAQLKVAEDVARQFVSYFREGKIENAINLSVTLDPTVAHFANLAEMLGRLSAQLAGSTVRKLDCTFNGKTVNAHARTLSVFALQGLLGAASEETVNLVNAPYLAERLGISLTRQADARSTNFINQITVTAEVEGEDPICVTGTLFDGTEARIVRLWNYNVEFRPSPHVLIMRYPDQPGQVGLFGSILGRHNVNIADMTVGRCGDAENSVAAVVLTLDHPVPAEALEELRKEIGIQFMRTVSL